MAKLHFLGTGGGLLCPGRNASSCLLETEDGDFLFDSGEPVSVTLKNLGYDWKRLIAIFISHTHADHLGGFPMLIQQLHLSRRENPLFLYGPSEYMENIFGHLSIYYLFPENFSFSFNSFSLENKKNITLSGIEVVPVKNNHLLYMKEKLPRNCKNKLEAFSFVIRAGEKAVLYSGDLKSVEDIKDYVEKCNYVIIESTHISPEDITDLCVKNRETLFIINHIGPDFDLEGFNLLKTKKGLSNVEISEDGKIIEF